MTLRPHAMTKEQAGEIVGQLISKWPLPELDDDGLALEIAGVLDTGLTYDEARLAIRHLVIGAHRWRPSVGDLVEIVRPPRRPEFPATTAGPDWRRNEQVRAQHQAELARTRALLAKASRPTIHQDGAA